MKNIIFTTISLLFFACSKSSDLPSPTEIRNTDIQNIIDKQIDILPVSTPKQLKIKTIKATYVGLDIVGDFNYIYDDKGRITNVNYVSKNGVGNNILNVIYDESRQAVIENGLSYKTNIEGTIIALADKPDFQSFVYKKGYPLEKNGEYLNNFDSNGNIISSERRGKGKFTFEYTNFPNNIRQDISGIQAFQLNFRDVYSGKFSTNLIKKCTLADGGFANDELIFDYEFDETQRVSKMIVNRASDKKTFIYEYTYF